MQEYIVAKSGPFKIVTTPSTQDIDKNRYTPHKEAECDCQKNMALGKIKESFKATDKIVTIFARDNEIGSYNLHNNHEHVISKHTSSLCITDKREIIPFLHSGNIDEIVHLLNDNWNEDVQVSTIPSPFTVKKKNKFRGFGPDNTIEIKKTSDDNKESTKTNLPRKKRKVSIGRNRYIRYVKYATGLTALLCCILLYKCRNTHLWPQAH